LAAGRDATEDFYGLHRKDILERPTYSKLVVGRVKGFKTPSAAEFAATPYGEAMGFWRMHRYSLSLSLSLSLFALN
jgi:hypothetical protein